MNLRRSRGRSKLSGRNLRRTFDIWVRRGRDRNGSVQGLVSHLRGKGTGLPRSRDLRFTAIARGHSRRGLTGLSVFEYLSCRFREGARFVREAPQSVFDTTVSVLCSRDKGVKGIFRARLCVCGITQFVRLIDFPFQTSGRLTRMASGWLSSLFIFGGPSEGWLTHGLAHLRVEADEWVKRYAIGWCGLSHDWQRVLVHHLRDPYASCPELVVVTFAILSPIGHWFHAHPTIVFE